MGLMPVRSIPLHPQPGVPVRILCRHTICSLWVATPQPPFGCCISLYRSDYLLTLSRPSHFHPLGCTLLRSGFPRRFDSRYTFKNVLLFLHRHIQTDSPSSSRVSLFLHVSASRIYFPCSHQNKKQRLLSCQNTSLYQFCPIQHDRHHVFS